MCLLFVGVMFASLFISLLVGVMFGIGFGCLLVGGYVLRDGVTVGLFYYKFIPWILSY